MGDNDKGRKGGGAPEIRSCPPTGPVIHSDLSASDKNAQSVPAVPSIELIEVQIEALQKKLDAEWATASSAVTDRSRRPVVPKDFSQACCRGTAAQNMADGI